MSKSLHLHIRCDEHLKNYLAKYGGDSKGVYELYHTHKDLASALRDGGLDTLSPSDLVGLVRCMVNDKKRLTVKSGRAR